MITDLFQFILDNYITGDNCISKSSPLYEKLIHSIPDYFKLLNPLRRDLFIKGSMGQGNKTNYPWISIINSNITSSTKNGLYIAYLFKKDMSGFYLTLDQGITYFEEKYKRKKYDACKRVVEYFQNHIDDDYFSKEKINLVDTHKGTLGYGYEMTTIISKYYESGKFSDDELVSDYNKMIAIYDEIYKNMNTNNYNEIIDRIINFTRSDKEHFVCADEAIEVIKTALDPIDGQPYDFSKQLKEVKPFVDKSTKYKEITNPLISKTDYIKKAKRDAEIGYLGEKLVIEYEKQRLNRLNLSEYADKVKWQSLKSDGFGYDILSYDLFGSEIKQIYIEVKTTTNKVDCEFPVSVGEVMKSKQLKKQYCLYRIYDVLKEPKFYRVSGSIEEHFLLDPITYLAKYKG